MELRDYLTRGEQQTKGAKALATLLHVAPTSISDAKAGRRGLPLAACFKLADLIGVPRDAVAAASELVKEKDEATKKYLRPFAQNLGKAATIFMTSALSVIFWTAGNEAQAEPARTSDTIKVSPLAASARHCVAMVSGQFVLC